MEAQKGDLCIHKFTKSVKFPSKLFPAPSYWQRGTFLKVASQQSAPTLIIRGHVNSTTHNLQRSRAHTHTHTECMVIRRVLPAHSERR